MSELKVTKVVNLTGEVRVEDPEGSSGAIVMALSGTISSDPKVASRYTEAITNTNMYYTYIDQARTQIDEFKAKFREIEDSVVESPVFQENSEPTTDPTADPEA